MEGGRPGRTLTMRLRPPRLTNDILEVHCPGGQVNRATSDIMDEFLRYYFTLYSFRQPDAEQQEDYLDLVTLQCLAVPDRLFLSAPFSLDEIRDAIGGLRAGKAPGSDRFPVDFYKLSIDILAPVLQAL